MTAIHPAFACEPGVVPDPPAEPLGPIQALLRRAHEPLLAALPRATRHRKRVIILHQGPLVEYRRYAGDEYSEIARRMTNLFCGSAAARNSRQRPTTLPRGRAHPSNRARRPRAVEVRAGDCRQAARPRHRLHLRTASLAVQWSHPLPGLHDRGSRARRHLLLGASRYAPRPGYKARWDVKRTEYLECGIGPHEDGGGPEGTLVETRDEPGGRLDAAEIAAVIDGVVLGNA